MRSSGFQNASLLLALCYLTFAVFGALGPLGVSWSKDLAIAPAARKMAWFSVLEFDGILDKENLPDAQLAWLAQQAWNEMKVDHDSKPWKDTEITNSQAGKVPGAMIALVKDRKVYLASSQRSSLSKSEKSEKSADQKIAAFRGIAWSPLISPKPVRDALRSCLIRYEDDAHHITGGNCGEQLAAVLAFNEITDKSEKLPGSRMVAWANIKDVPRVIAPCGDVPDEDGRVSGNPGCQSFIKALEIVAIPESTKPEKFDAKFTARQPCLGLSVDGKTV
ncbi:MAG: hypothetical protein Q9174_002459 [Haloplaca sp. 1 TL-2023]